MRPATPPVRGRQYPVAASGCVPSSRHLVCHPCVSARRQWVSSIRRHWHVNRTTPGDHAKGMAALPGEALKPPGGPSEPLRCYWSSTQPDPTGIAPMRLLGDLGGFPCPYPPDSPRRCVVPDCPARITCHRLRPGDHPSPRAVSGRTRRSNRFRPSADAAVAAVFRHSRRRPGVSQEEENW